MLKLPIKKYRKVDSPAMVKAMEEDEAFKEEVKEMIDGMLTLIREVIE